MAGFLIHLGFALVCLIIVHLIHFKWEYSLSIFAGNFLPDVINFGITSIKQFTLNIYNITHDKTYQLLNGISSSYTNWFTLGFFIFSLTLLLYHFHIVKKKTMEEYDELYIFLLIGIIIHLVLDVLFIESNVFI